MCSVSSKSGSIDDDFLTLPTRSWPLLYGGSDGDWSREDDAETEDFVEAIANFLKVGCGRVARSLLMVLHRAADVSTSYLSELAVVGKIGGNKELALSQDSWERDQLLFLIQGRRDDHKFYGPPPLV